MSEKTEKTHSTKKKDIIGILLLAFSVILMISFVSGGDRKYVGAIGSLLSAGLNDFLGYVCYIIPFIFIWWAITEFRHKKFYFKYSMVIGLMLIILGGATLIHIIFGDPTGGILGDFTSDVIIQFTFGQAGVYIISVAMIIVSVILMADISIKKIITGLISLISSALNKVKLKIKENKVKLQVKKEKKAEFLKKPLKADKEKKKKMPKPNQKLKISKPKKHGIKEKKNTNVNTDIELPGYVVQLNFLEATPVTELNNDEEISRGNKLIDVLANFDIEAEISAIQVGPAITRYEITLPPDIKLSRIRNLDSNIAMALEAKTVRLLTPIPGKAAVGVEVPAIIQETVYMKTLIESNEFSSINTEIPYCLGKSIDGELIVADLSMMPHLLLAGATGSGKSIAIHVLINSILYKSSPDDVKFILIDPKRVELSVYNGIPHMDTEVITDANKAVKVLQAVTREMDERYDILSKNNVADINAYNKKELKDGPEKLPRIVVVIDELADLMVLAKDKVESAIVRIAQMARAVGIHLVLATQRPSVDVITGVIKANLPARIAFNVLSGVDSRTILDSIGAEKLLGKGDMLYLSSELPQPERLQGGMISRGEIEKIVEHLSKMDYESKYKLDLEEKSSEDRFKGGYSDEIYPEAVKMIIRMNKASISLLQRRLGIGYNRAARLIDRMEDSGIISGDNGVKGREVLTTEDYLENFK